MGAAAVINRHFQNGEKICRQLSKRLPNNRTIFAVEATAITLALDYYRYMDPVKHNIVVYSDSNVLLAGDWGRNYWKLIICHIMNLPWALSDKGTRARFCWVPSHCGIEGNEIVDQLAKQTLDHDIDPLATVHYADLKPVVNSYIQQEVQIKWDVYIHYRDLYIFKQTLGSPKKFKHLTRAEEVVITRLRIGHTKATKSQILSRGPPTACQHCGQTDHWAHAPGVDCVTANSWWILHGWLIEDPLWDNSRNLHSRVSERSGVLLSYMKGHIFSTTHYWNHSTTYTIRNLYQSPHLNNTTGLCNLSIEHK